MQNLATNHGTDSNLKSEFADNISDVLHRIEGITHFNIAHLYTFDYFTDHNSHFNPSYGELIDEWYRTFYSSTTNMRLEVQKSADKVRK